MIGWGISLVLAYSIAGVLAAAGIVISGLLTGSAMCTTAIGTILPVMRDTGQLTARFGPMMLAAGAVGELGPILIVTLVLSTESGTGTQALLLAAFVLLTILAAVASHATIDRAWPFLDRSMDSSGQVPVRLTVLLVFALVVIASKLGLDIILGATARHWPCSRPPSCRSWWRSPVWASSRVRCDPRQRWRWSPRPSSRC